MLDLLVIKTQLLNIREVNQWFVDVYYKDVFIFNIDRYVNSSSDSFHVFIVLLDASDKMKKTLSQKKYDYVSKHLGAISLKILNKIITTNDLGIIIL